MGPKQELLSEADATYTELRAAVDGIPDARMSETWLGTWGAREILIHVSGWHREMIPALGRIGRGQAPYPDGVSYDDFDTWNARFVEAELLLHLLQLGGIRFVEGDPHEAILAADVLSDVPLLDVGKLPTILVGGTVDEHGVVSLSSTVIGRAALLNRVW